MQKQKRVPPIQKKKEVYIITNWTQTYCFILTVAERIPWCQRVAGCPGRARVRVRSQWEAQLLSNRCCCSQSSPCHCRSGQHQFLGSCALKMCASQATLSLAQSLLHLPQRLASRPQAAERPLTKEATSSPCVGLTGCVQPILCRFKASSFWAYACGHGHLLQQRPATGWTEAVLKWHGALSLALRKPSLRFPQDPHKAITV